MELLHIFWGATLCSGSAAVVSALAAVLSLMFSYAAIDSRARHRAASAITNYIDC